MNDNSAKYFIRDKMHSRILISFILSLSFLLLVGCKTPTLKEWVESQGYIYHPGYTQESRIGWQVSFDSNRDPNSGSVIRSNFQISPNNFFAFSQDTHGVASQSLEYKRTVFFEGGLENIVGREVPTNVLVNYNNASSIQINIDKGTIKRLLNLFPKQPLASGQRRRVYTVTREIRANNLSIIALDTNKMAIKVPVGFHVNMQTSSPSVRYESTYSSTIKGADILIGYDYETVVLIGTSDPVHVELKEHQYARTSDAYIRVGNIYPAENGGYLAEIQIVGNQYGMNTAGDTVVNVAESESVVGVAEPVGSLSNNEPPQNFREANAVEPTYITDSEIVLVRPASRLGTPGSHQDVVNFVIIDDITSDTVKLKVSSIGVSRTSKHSY